MARPAAAAKTSETGSQSTELFVYFKVVGEWQGPVAGSQPLRPTLPDHLARVLEQELTKVRKRQSKQPAAAGIAAAEEVENGQPVLVLTEMEQYLREALEDPLLDDAARQVLQEVLQPVSPGKMLARTIGRSTTTFPRSKSGAFYVPDIWWMGAMKVALRNFRNMFPDQAREVVKRCFSVYPKELDLGTKEPSQIIEVNVQLDTVSSQQAKASIKRVHLVVPTENQFVLVVKVLNGALPAIKDLINNMESLWRAMGEAGVGGLRPQYGRFAVVSCSRITEAEAQEFCGRC